MINMMKPAILEALTTAFTSASVSAGAISSLQTLCALRSDLTTLTDNGAAKWHGMTAKDAWL